MPHQRAGDPDGPRACPSISPIPLFSRHCPVGLAPVCPFWDFLEILPTRLLVALDKSLNLSELQSCEED